MLSVLCSGRLVRDPQTRTGKGGKPYTTGLIACPIEAVNEGDNDRVLVSCIAFGPAAEALVALGKGDDVSVAGQARLRVETAKWIRSKLKPRKFGDILQHAGDSDQPLNIKIIDYSKCE